MDRIKLLKEFLVKEPLDDFLNYALALEYIKNNQSDNAEKILVEIITRNANYLPVYYQLGKLFEKNNQLSKALQFYSAGVLIAEHKNDKKTISELKEAIVLISDDFQA